MVTQTCTVRSREVGARLREAIYNAGFHTQGQVADELGRHESGVSRLLSGHRGGRATDVAALLGLCRITGPERDYILGLCEPGDELRLSGEHRWPRYEQHLTEATTLVAVAPVALPVPVQTSGYARALVESTGLVGEVAHQEVHARMGLRAVCGVARRQVHVLVAEHVLRTPVGGPSVMATQLGRLADLASQGWTSVRVVPANVGAHPAMTGGFTLASFPGFRPVVAREEHTATVLMDAPAEVASYQRAADRLAALALDAQRSRRLIGSLAWGWRTGLVPAAVMPLA